jgi:hypothetical protein
MWGPFVSEREGKEAVPVWRIPGGPWAIFAAGPKGRHGALFIFFPFLPFLFRFLISFITFANLVQFSSNQFVKFSKFQSNIPEQ